MRLINCFAPSLVTAKCICCGCIGVYREICGCGDPARVINVQSLRNNAGEQDHTPPK